MGNSERRQVAGWDLVCFLFGCSFSFESALLSAGVPVRNLEEDCNVSMYIINRTCIPAGPFTSPLVVSSEPGPSWLRKLPTTPWLICL